MKDFSLKCVQLDLARQKENIDFIKEFITFIAGTDYNSVLLYLEDRIRTKSYPYPDENASYSVSEMKDLVNFAAQYNIELIPCVATLGHAERFLAHKELAHLAEVQENMTNRFGNLGSKDVFCITNPEFYTFIENYISEVAEIFPSAYFHAGLDEFFNFNLCDRCREAMPDLAAEENMFLKHIIRINDSLIKLGKRMMMWSDMFEIYTTVISRIPKNIIMVDWQYNQDIRFYLHHLFDQKAEDRMKLNNSLGLDTIMAPAELYLSNSESCLNYADQKDAWGFLLTSWEKTDTFMYRSFPAVFYCGELMGGKTPDEAWKNMIKAIFNSDSALLSHAVKLALASQNLRHFAEAGKATMFIRPFTGLPIKDFTVINTVRKMLTEVKDHVNSDLGRKVFKDICYAVEEKYIKNSLKHSCWDIFDFGFKQEFFDRATDARNAFEALIDAKAADWQEFRSGIVPNVFTMKKASVLDSLDQSLAAIREGNYLKIRFVMTDIYVVNYFDAELLINNKWHKVISRNAMKPDCAEAIFEMVVPIEKTERPEALRLSVYGMGGRGISYVELHTGDGKTYIPTNLICSTGDVEHPEVMLNSDGRYAQFNSNSMEKDYHDPASVHTVHSVTLKLEVC